VELFPRYSLAALPGERAQQPQQPQPCGEGSAPAVLHHCGGVRTGELLAHPICLLAASASPRVALLPLPAGMGARTPTAVARLRHTFQIIGANTVEITFVDTEVKLAGGLQGWLDQLPLLVVPKLPDWLQVGLGGFRGAWLLRWKSGCLTPPLSLAPALRRLLSHRGSGGCRFCRGSSAAA
jgi:hypothetical protein